MLGSVTPRLPIPGVPGRPARTPRTRLHHRDAQGPPAHVDPLEMAEELPRHAGGQVHDGVIVLDIDGPDEAAFEARLVGDGADDLPRGHAVTVTHLDTVADHLRTAPLPTLRAAPALLTLLPRDWAFLAKGLGLTTVGGMVAPGSTVVRPWRPIAAGVAPRRLLPIAAPVTASFARGLAPKPTVWTRIGPRFWSPIRPPIWAVVGAVVCALIRPPGRPLGATSVPLPPVVPAARF